MELTHYPVIAQAVSVSKVTTHQGEDTIIFNTLTGKKAYPNTDTYEVVRRCRGDKTLEDIVQELSSLSGEDPSTLRQKIAPLLEKMEKASIIYDSPTPLYPVREIHEAVLHTRLENVAIELTHQCNLRCKHCYSNAGEKRNDELTTDEIRNVLDDAASLGVFNIILTGGEPLLHPDLVDIISYVREKPMVCMLFTNGSLITPDMVKRIQKAGIHTVATSLDGLHESHDTFRGIPGSYERTVQSIRLLKEAGIPVRLNISIHKGNLTQLIEMMDLLREWGITNYYLWPISFSGRRGPEGESITLTPREYEDVIRTLRNHDEHPPKEIAFISNPVNCGIGRGQLFIRSDGTVSPCPQFPDDVSLGNVRENSLKDIWNDSTFLNEARAIDPRNSEMCSRCEHLKVCKGGCIAEHYARTGKLGCGDPLECAYFRAFGEYTPVEVERNTLSVEIR